MMPGIKSGSEVTHPVSSFFLSHPSQVVVITLKRDLLIGREMRFQGGFKRGYAGGDRTVVQSHFAYSTTLVMGKRHRAIWQKEGGCG